MLDVIIPKVRSFLFNPVETFQNSRMDKTRAVISYFGILLLFYAGMIAVFEMAMLFLTYLLSAGSAGTYGMSSGTSPEMTLAMVIIIPLAVFFAIVIGGSLIMLIFGLWTHLWVYLLGGRNGFMQTLHAILYSMTPGLLLGWIPLVGMFASVWALILFFFGIREFQELSDGKTVEVILFSVFLPMVILAILFILVIIAITSHGGLFASPGSYR
jgi:hypothetical protein